MKLLALDTSSNACSVAVQDGTEVYERHDIEPKAHTNILLPMIRDVLAEARVTITDLDAVVLGNGPGSFIGMRIGASVAQGISYGAGRKIVPVSSLAAVAAEVMETGDADRVLITQDARMHEVYVGAFERDASGLPLASMDEQIHAIGPLPGADSGIVAAGAGWQRYPELLEFNRDLVGEVSDVHYPRARFLLRLGDNALSAGRAVSPEALIPTYLRMKVAEKPGKQT